MSNAERARQKKILSENNPLPAAARELQGRKKSRFNQRRRRAAAKSLRTRLLAYAVATTWRPKLLKIGNSKGSKRVAQQAGPCFASAVPETSTLRKAAANLECYLSEANCRKFIERNPGLQKFQKFSIDDIKINRDEREMQPEWIQKLERLVKEFLDIFATDDSEPPVMNPDLIKPVEFVKKDTMKDADAHCYKPSLGLHQKKLMRAYRERGVDQGFLSRSSSRFASRAHMTMKPGKDEIRFAWDCRKINELLAKLPPNLPNMVEQLQKQSKSRFFTSTDAKKGYHQLALSPATKKMLAVWMDDGLYEPNRLVEGAKNSGTHYQAAVSTALHSLPEDTQNSLSNYLDDFLIGGSTFDEYYKSTKRFFEMCRLYRITLHPKKTSLGFTNAKFVGHEVFSEDGKDIKVRIHEENLKPLANAVPPGSKVELQRFLGLCNYARDHVEGYSKIAAPLQALTGKVPWEWKPRHQAAFLELKKAVHKGFPLHAADYSRPFYLFTDASDFGMGAALVQFEGEVKDEDIGKISADRKKIVAFYSSAFNESMQKRPVYYREARALIWAMGKARRHLELSQHQVVLVTDHNPLVWIQNTHRGTVTSWLLEEAAELDYRVVYTPGPTNSDADATSRPPIVRPGVLNAVGTMEAWAMLLKHLPKQTRSAKKTFVWAGANTDNVARMVQAWREPTNPVKRAAPKSMSKHPAQDILMVCPDPEWSPVVAKQIIQERKDKIRACLVQSDLINFIPSADGTLDMDCKTVVEKASKITFLATNLTWLVFDGKGRSTIVSSEKVSEVSSEGWLPPPFASLEGYAVEASKPGLYHEDNLQRWREETENDAAIVKKNYGTGTAITEGGVTLIMAGSSDGKAKVYVPSTLRKGLVKEAHVSSNHAWNLYPTLKEKYIWPGMAADINRWTHECAECPPAKAKRNNAHGQFRMTDYIKPRTAYGVDFYGIAKSDAGYVGVMTIVDLFTRHVQYIPVKDMKGDTAARALLKHVVLSRGAPKTIVSDAAKAFVGKMVGGLCQLMKTRQVVTQYYPEGNALTERNHVVLGEALRLMPADRRKTWEDEMPKVAYAVNSTVNSTTGFSPFELECGQQPCAPADLLFLKPPKKKEMVFENWSAEPEVYRGIVDGIRLYHDIAEKYSKAKKLEMNRRLNSKGKGIKTYDVGDPVVVYVPTANENATKKGKAADTDMGWKSKHRLNWKYGTIVEKTGATTYVVQERYGTRRYTRSVSCIQPDRAVHEKADVARVVQSGQVKGAVQTKDAVYAINDIVAVVEDYENSTFELGQIKEFVEDDKVRLHFFGTTRNDVKKANFRPVYQDRQGRSFFHKEQGATPWLGTINIEDILTKIEKLGTTGALLAKDRNKLKSHKLFYLQ